MEINHPDFKPDSDDPFVRQAYQMYLKQQESPEVEEPEEEDISHDTKINCLRGWGVPERILDNLEVLRATKAVNIVKNWTDTPKEAWCLILSADKGTGKSTAAATWLYNNVPQNISTYPRRYWWSGTRIARTNGYAKEFESMMRSRFMVIDDLGVEYLDKNGNFLQRLDELIDERYSNYRQTIITTNLNVKAFKERYGERVADRIREGFEFGGAFMELAESSMRVRK